MIAAVGSKKHQVDPALELSAKDEHGLREAGDASAGAHAQRVDEAQKMIGQDRVLAEYGFDVARIGVCGDQLHESQGQ